MSNMTEASICASGFGLGNPCRRSIRATRAPVGTSAGSSPSCRPGNSKYPQVVQPVADERWPAWRKYGHVRRRWHIVGQQHDNCPDPTRPSVPGGPGTAAGRPKGRAPAPGQARASAKGQQAPGRRIGDVGDQPRDRLRAAHAGFATNCAKSWGISAVALGHLGGVGGFGPRHPPDEVRGQTWPGPASDRSCVTMPSQGAPPPAMGTWLMRRSIIMWSTSEPSADPRPASGGRAVMIVATGAFGSSTAGGDRPWTFMSRTRDDAANLARPG